MMKHYLLTAIFCIFFMMNMSACHRSSQNIVGIDILKTYDIQKGVQEGHFSTLLDASMVEVRAVQNKVVPVHGSLNLSGGTLCLNCKDSVFSLDVDLGSWDSGLLERDKNVTDILFNSAKYKTAHFSVNTLNFDLNKFKKEQKIQNVSGHGVLEMLDYSVPLQFQINAFFDSRGVLVVETAKPIVLKLSDLGLSTKLVDLILAGKLSGIDNEVQLSTHLEFAPLEKTMP